MSGSALRRGAAALAALLVPATALVVAPPAVAEEDGGCNALKTTYLDTETYALPRLAVPQSWWMATGQGVDVAVVDSGIHPGNAHLRDALGPGVSFVPGDRAKDGHTDVQAHGTIVAGIIGARYVEGSSVVGVAPSARLMPVRVYMVQDGDAWQEPNTRQIADGIRWAADNGAEVINVSMSTVKTDPSLPYLEEAVAHAVKKDALVLASGGNGPVSDDVPPGPRYPAAFPGVIGVAASDEYDRVTDDSIHGSHIDLYAPGQNVLTTYLGAGDCLVGSRPYSSYAVAFVSGAAALLREKYPRESAAEIAYRLMASADRPVRSKRDDRHGWGLVQPYSALSMTLDPDRVGPPFPGKAKRREPPRRTGLEPLADRPDRLAPARNAALWWGVLAGGLAAFAFIVRPWLTRPRGRRVKAEG